MIRGLPASIIAHAAVFGASYLTFPYWGVSSRAMIDIEVVDVEFAEIGEITNIAPLIEREPEEEEAAPIEEPEIVPEEPVDEELPEAEQDVTNEDSAPAEEDPEDVLPDFEPPEEPEDEPEPEPEPEREPETQPTPPRDPLADFLNQSESTFKSEIETRKERPEPRPLPPEEQPKSALEDAPIPAETRNRRGAGERNGNTARLEALVVSRIRNECWAGVDDLPNPERYNVQMKVLLNENGTIADLSLVNPTRRPIGASYMGTAVDRALTAVRKCEPFRLPRDDYELWKEINVYLGLGYADR
ncbi:MAG: hypothetical protein NXH72_03210 [Hyphomonadaceae bacterium]|nr:hypothetical protein [Hyphomonadaceae bacterium]